MSTTWSCRRNKSFIGAVIVSVRSCFSDFASARIRLMRAKSCERCQLEPARGLRQTHHSLPARTPTTAAYFCCARGTCNDSRWVSFAAHTVSVQSVAIGLFAGLAIECGERKHDKILLLRNARPKQVFARSRRPSKDMTTSAASKNRTQLATTRM